MNLYPSILERAKKREGSLVDFLVDLVAIPSPSGGEKAVTDRVAGEMRRFGFDEVRIDGLGNVIGRVGGGPRLIAFDAHVDTVEAGDRAQWSFDPFRPRVAEGKVWGRGAADQKGGLAAMVHAGGLVREMGLDRGLTLLFIGSVQEEDCEGMAWKYLIEEEKIRPELVVLSEPTSLNIYRGHRGRMEIKVEVRGRSAHGSAPERGDNAAYKAACIALEIEKLNERLAVDAFLGKGTVAVTEIATGSPSLCAVPDAARLHLDRRLTAGETKESALAEVRDAAVRAGIPDVRVFVPESRAPSHTGKVVPYEKYFPTWVLEEGSSWLRQAVSVYKGLFGREPKVDKWTFSTNGVGIMPVYGIPCLGFGPGDEPQAHAADECCPVQDLPLAAAFYAALVAKLSENG
ncbi:MAG: YgeY family selenium metabolism-linked hydrolase [Candidatus Aminicenantes bacterium]|nr:YgeY family selenium metabolism-linked hydrolase [Candidatus Aminicenantes bacterium]